MKNRFTGTGVAMVTPFDDNNQIDYTSLKKLIAYLIDNDVDYLVVMGTTAEYPCISEAEKAEILDFTKKEINGRIPIVYAIGGNNTTEVIRKISSMDYTGISGILSVTPAYNKPNQEGLYKHFSEISRVSPLPIILYNVPGRTSVNMLPKTILRLAHDFENIIAVKEASGNMENVMEIVKNKPVDFTVISGEDALNLPLISIGVEGVISVVGNAFPKECSEMVKLAINGDFINALPIHYKLLEAAHLMFEEGNPTGVKAFLSELGIIKNNLRLPLIPASKPLTEKIKNETKKFLTKI
jgi:4-hydroxy-tetrahydrodipicolinate synthase